jgi:hypothetical protein
MRLRMNLDDLIGNAGILQDDCAAETSIFGNNGQLKVVGHNGSKGNKKQYILYCSVCSKDPELFGEGYFSSTKSSLDNNSIPCGCSTAPRWSKEQYFVLCSRKAKELGYKFIGFESDWAGHKTKIKMFCEKHEEWATLSKGVGCPSCRTDKMRAAKLKPDSVIVESFMATGSFVSGTKFWRSERTNNLGWFAYWNMYCPECEEYAEPKACHLIQGSIPCACSKRRQKECYITWLVDENNNPIAIKFGITNNLKRRIKEQNKLSKYSVQKGMVFAFPTVLACKRAERECKEELVTKFMSKSDLPDGYTETTDISNLFRIVEIYKRNGGILI